MREVLDYTVEMTNRFKGLDLIDRVPEELWMEGCDILQWTGVKTIPKKKKFKKAKWLSEETLQIAVKRSSQSRREKERYTHLNAEFQRIARRDKKAFLSDLGFPCGSAGKESARNAGGLGLIPGLGRFSGEGRGYLFKYSGLETSMDCILPGSSVNGIFQA